MKYTGIIMIVIGALILTASYFSDALFSSGTVDQNWIQLIAAALIILGIPAHIIVSRKAMHQA